jgi:3-mercaptopyruvate sulfurtransferase SseA
MTNEISSVLEFGMPEPGEAATMMEDKLRFHTDSWDLSVDLKAALADIVVIDARSRDAYIIGHIPGAVSFPHREMNAETAARLNPQQGLCRLLRRDRLQMHRPRVRISSRSWDFAPRSYWAASIGGVATDIR